MSRKKYKLTACVKQEVSTFEPPHDQQELTPVHRKLLCDEIEQRNETVVIWLGVDSHELQHASIVWVRSNT